MYLEKHIPIRCGLALVLAWSVAACKPDPGTTPSEKTAMDMMASGEDASGDRDMAKPDMQEPVGDMTVVDPGDMTGTTPDQGITPSDGTRSSHGRLKFKGGKRLAREWSRTFGLSVEQMCSEPSGDGAKSCFEVHDIVLGGVEPYKLRIFDPVQTTPVAAPIAVERIALSACTKTIEEEAGAPSQAKLFVELLDQQAPDAADYEAVGIRLYRSLLARDPSDAELDVLRAQTPTEDSLEIRRSWALTHCFALATHVEALFY